MSDKRAEPSRTQEQPRSQISGRRKDEFIRRVLQEVPDLDEETAAEVARHLGAAIATVKTDRTLIERYQKPAFDPNAFSLMKVYRTSGERGLRERLRGIEESRHLQALAKAQQISLPRSLRGGGADASVLQEAIVKGVVSRHEDWLAAS
jgi:DNA-binding transcriptional regulator YbjK